MTRNSTCNECGATMQEGYILDAMGHMLLPANWVQGKPEKTPLLGLTTTNRATHPLEAYRCPNCGFVKLYANSEHIE